MVLDSIRPFFLPQPPTLGPLRHPCPEQWQTYLLGWTRAGGSAVTLHCIADLQRMQIENRRAKASGPGTRAYRPTPRRSGAATRLTR